MLDNGYSLARVELLNWGNFHGYQKFSLHEPATDGLLFAPHPASAILGVNGSGKSTLIDALMVALLPFEGSIKLGVTNDVEAGAGGGRTIRDYVLGKHSSNSSVVSDPEAIFGRKEGCAFVVLNFVHNRHPGRVLTLGRAWWFQNYKVSETQLAFVSYDRHGVQDFCPGGKTPATVKAFRQYVKTELPSVQIFETMQNYFTTLSQALGRVSRDDFKILNRAFFVKSISNIDQFIRENMLIEQESPNLDRLMENVRNGQEIAHTIEICEEKLSAVTRILRELKKLCECVDARLVVDRRLRLLSLHREWREWRDLLRQRDELSRASQELSVRLPAARRDAAAGADLAQRAQERLQGDDSESRVAALDREAKALEEMQAIRRRAWEKWRERAKSLAMKLPLEAGAWPRFLLESEARIEESREKVATIAQEMEDIRSRRFALDVSSREIRDELQHIAQNGTLIPRELHALREAAIRDLRLEPRDLMFVGELLQVRRESLASRVAVESVLFPIARNLLCHPAALQTFTRWLDEQGLRADVTVKRISDDELEVDVESAEYASDASVLACLEMRPESKHPFSGYLWKWLRDSFDYEIVDLKRFRTSDGKLVTREGLVKKDQRTMRKLKKGFPFSLGWDNEDTIARLSSELGRLNSEHSGLTSKLTELSEEMAKAEDRIRFLQDIRDGHQDIMLIEADDVRLQALALERARMLEANPDLQALRDEVRDAEARARGLAQGVFRLESDLESKTQLLTQVTSLIPAREAALKLSKAYQEMRVDLGGESDLESALVEVDRQIQDKGQSRLQIQADLEEELQKIDLARSRALTQASVQMGRYRDSYSDPNLPYEIASDLPAAVLYREWGAAERRLRETELPGAQDKWGKFFNQILVDSVKDTINEIKSRIHEIGETIRSINDVLKLTNFEDLVHEQRYLRIEAQTSEDERIRKFRKSMGDVERTLTPTMRLDIQDKSREVMTALSPFVESFQKDPAYRAYSTDVRNHFQFSVQSLRRGALAEDDAIVEVFSGARRDAKSSAQTTQLAYALLASCLAYRFRFHDPVAGADTPRLIILDEFGGKFDNEKPREILKLLEKMGFQSILVSPMSKADLLADGISHLVLVHKVSASRSKVQSYQLASKEDYDRLLASSRADVEVKSMELKSVAEPTVQRMEA
ncbi:MAG: AAA family ATPase [Bdellovibrionaceae bacterium]|nr:AAA family ATPase [Pseudobdellovibrionaceae bacterium]